jgi:bloom syndrome protein
MESLDDIHQSVVEEFVLKGREECHMIMMQKGLKSQPFTDVMLREMAIRFPRTLEGLREIKDINPEMVDRYGTKMIRLIKETKAFYDDMVRGGRTAVPKPYDPNHENVIDLLSDGDDAVEGPSEHDFSDDEFEPLEESVHFASRSSGSGHRLPVSRDVEQFNAMFAQQSIVPSTNYPSQRPAANLGNPVRQTSQPGGTFRGKKKFTNFRGGKRAGYARKSSGGGGRRRGASGGGRTGGSHFGRSSATGGVGAMPT